MQLCCLQFGASCHFGAILRNYSKLPCIYILSFSFSPFSFCPMASPIPNVLIAVNSSVKRLHSDLQWKFDHRAAVDFNLRWLNTVLRAVSSNSRDGDCFNLDKQTWRGKSNGKQKTISQNLLIKIL